MEHTKDLDTMLGEPKKAIRSMTLPLLVSYLVVQVNLFADTSWCSGLGADASSAVSSIMPVYWILAGLGVGLGVGLSATMAASLGRDDDPHAAVLLSQTLVVSTILGIVLVPVLALSMSPLLDVMGAEALEDMSIAYIMPQIVCAPVFMLNGVVSGAIRAEGAAKRSMTMLLLASVLNMVLDPVLMYGLDMGLMGAGIATSVSTIISTYLGLHWYMRGRLYVRPTLKGFRFRKDAVSEVFSIGVPRSFESIIINAMSLFQRVFIISCGGVIGVALYNMPWRFVALAMVISQAISAAMIPVCSAALATKQKEKVEIGYRYSFRLSLALMLLVGIIMFIAADLLVVPFTYEPSMAEIRPEFAKVLRIYAIFVPFMAMIDVGSAILQTVRCPKVSMVSSFVRNVIIVCIMAVSTTMDGIYLSIFVAEIIGGFIMMVPAMYCYGRYRKRFFPSDGDIYDTLT